MKTAIFGGNNARLYNFKPEQRAELRNDQLAHYKALYEKHGAGRTNLAYGYALKARSAAWRARASSCASAATIATAAVLPRRRATLRSR